MNRIALLFVIASLLGACRTKDALDTGADTGLFSDCEEADPSNIAVNPNCTFTPPAGAFNFSTEWSMSTFADFPAHKKSYSSPMVGQFSDDSQNGVVDEWDVPDIVAVFDSRSDWRGVVRLISGDGSKVFWSTYDALYLSGIYYPYRYATPAIGDVDGDLLPEIALTVYDYAKNRCYAGMYETNGNLEWVYLDEELPCRSHSPALADMDADGDVEVVFGHLILDAATGVLKARGSGGSGYHDDYFNSGYQSVPIDLNGDGLQELVTGSDIYDSTGSTICSTGYPDGYPAIADLDGDNLGEIVVTGNGYLRIFEDNCALIDEWVTAGYGYGGPSTIADFDGDGEPEITVADKSRFTLYEVDGTVVWSVATDETSSGATASSVFDFDGDGAAEVVYGDELALWVLDGKTGQVMLEDSNHTSGTVHEYPIIADVDGDGQAEILVTNSDANSGLYLIGEDDNYWVGARFLWNQHAYNIVNVLPNLGIPQVPEPNWPLFNSFRQGGTGAMNPQGAHDLWPEDVSVCQDKCAGPLRFVFQVGNSGVLRAGPKTRIGLYGVREDGTEVALGAVSLGETLYPGQVSASYTLDLDASLVEPFERWFLYVDDTGISNECDETDNKVDVDLSDICWEATDTSVDPSDSGGESGTDSGKDSSGSSDSGEAPSTSSH
jgi:hypothetical protein